MWFKNLFKINNKSSYERDGHNIKNSTIINNNEKLNDIYLMMGELKGTLTSINNELRYIHNKLDRVDEETMKLKNRIGNLENNYYRKNRRYT